MHRLAVLPCLLLFVGPPALAQSTDLPPPLRGWESWVLYDLEYRRCPIQLGRPKGREGHVCAWPATLELDLDAKGGRFTQRWRVYAEDWVPLPGDATAWPQSVQLNGASAAVVAHGGRPQLRLASGSYTVSGRFDWVRMPRSLAIPSETGLVSLSVDGRRVAAVERSDEALWLLPREAQSAAALPERAVSLRVFRKLTDAVPTLLTTRIALKVSGEAREETLARPLPDGYTAMRVVSPLPARLDDDGRLRVQLRPGDWQIELSARAASVVDVVGMPVVEGSWPAHETWSVQAVDRLRIVAIEGVPAVDPAQAGVPADWQMLPSFVLQPGEELKLVERSRGLAAADANRLRLGRDLWLDFDHSGFIARDQLVGTMREGWRLDMEAPWALLAASSSDGTDLLVTRGDEGHTGVELRAPELQLTTTARIDAARGRLPATGWSQRFDGADLVLHLPPGHRLIAAFGADESNDAWVNRWRLLDIFLVLLVAAASYRLLGWTGAGLALAALALSYHELNSPVWAWVHLVIVVALARAAPAGRLRKVASGWRALAFAVLVLALIPFSIEQLRFSLYPQLEYPYVRPLAEPMPAPPIAEQAPSAAMVPSAPVGVAMKEAIRATDEMVMTAARPESSVSYTPGTVVQTGPGIPRWAYQDHRIAWTGPVDAQQTLRVLIAAPFWLSLWRIAGVVLSVMFLFTLARLAYGRPSSWRLPEARTAAIWLLSWFATFSSVAPVVTRAEVPTPELLQELERRLAEPPRCLPDCLELPFAEVTIRGETLDLRLEVHALAALAVPLPGAGRAWRMESVSVDGRARDELRGIGTPTQLMVLEAGVHTVRISGPIQAANALTLSFPVAPRRLDVEAPGWQAGGLTDGRLLADALELTRRAAADGAPGPAETERAQIFPPFVRVHRQMALDLEWTVRTTVERLAPAEEAFTIEVPLLPGESVVTPGIEVRNGRVLAAIATGRDRTTWQSRLEPAERLQLAAADAAPLVEHWALTVGPSFHLQFTGTPAVEPENIDPYMWVHEFLPRPGESLELTITRPAASEGASLAIDHVSLSSSFGARSSTSMLDFEYRSTQGGRHVVRIPATALLESLEMDGNRVALRPEAGELALPLQPGSHQVAIRWQDTAGVSLRGRTPEVHLGTAASNVLTRLELPATRWILFESGSGVGPAILYWSELLVFLVLAVLIGRSGRTSLRTHEWLLLGLGLSTFSWWVLLIFVVWVFAMRWRGEWRTESDLRFNLVQIVLGILFVVTLVSLVSAIPNGLLGQPDMRIGGVGSGGGALSWFDDRIDGALPRKTVISVSLWWYKLAMLAWALWLSFALVRWVPSAWHAYTTGGIWRGRLELRRKRRAPATGATEQ